MADSNILSDFGINLFEEEIDDAIFKTNEFLTDATFTGSQGPFWWLSIVLGKSAVLVAINQLLIKSCLVSDFSNGTKMGQNLVKTYLSIFFHHAHVFKDLCHSVAKVLTFRETNEGNPLKVSFAVEFSSLPSSIAIFG